MVGSSSPVPLSVTVEPSYEKTAPAWDTGPPLVLFFTIAKAPTCNVLVYVQSTVSLAARLKLTVRVVWFVVIVVPSLVSEAEQSRLVNANVGAGSVSVTL